MRLEACARRTLRVPARFNYRFSYWSTSYIYVREIRTLSAISPENLDDEIVFYPVYINTMYNIVIVLVGIHANTPLADHREALTTNRHTRGYTTVRGSS